MRPATRAMVVAAGLLGAVTALPGPAAADETGAGSAPWLGGGTYSIEVSGDLGTVLEQVKAVTGMFVAYEGPQPMPATPVTLDLDDATPGEIMLEVCRQAGMVFEALGGARAVRLRPGDVAIDPRPAADSEYFVVHVDRVCITDRSTTTLRWGDPEPRSGAQSDLTIGLSITPKSPEFMEDAAGVARYASAITDAGEMLEVPKPRQGGDPAGSAMVVMPTPDAGTATLNLPAPKQAAGSIERLDAYFMSYSQLDYVQVDLAPRAGATAVDGDVSAGIQTFDFAGGVLSVALRVSYPALASAGTPVTTGRGDEVTASAVLKDGTSLRLQGNFTSMAYDGTKRTVEMRLTHRAGTETPPEVDHVEVLVTRRGGTLIETPFTIENIPLPPEAQ